MVVPGPFFIRPTYQHMRHPHHDRNAAMAAEDTATPFALTTLPLIATTDLNYYTMQRLTLQIGRAHV